MKSCGQEEVCGPTPAISIPLAKAQQFPPAEGLALQPWASHSVSPAGLLQAELRSFPSSKSLWWHSVTIATSIVILAKLLHQHGHTLFSRLWAASLPSLCTVQVTPLPSLILYTSFHSALSVIAGLLMVASSMGHVTLMLRMAWCHLARSWVSPGSAHPDQGELECHPYAGAQFGSQRPWVEPPSHPHLACASSYSANRSMRCRSPSQPPAS